MMDPHSFYLGCVAGAIGVMVVSVLALVVLLHFAAPYPTERNSHE